TYDVSATEEKPSQEKEADQFASFFLMPEELFNKELAQARGLPLVDLVFKLKRIFGVSWKTVLYRLASQSSQGNKLWPLFQAEYKRKTGRTVGFKEEPDGLTEEEFRSIRPAARAADEPRQLDEADFMRDRLERLVRLGVEKEVITLGLAAEILRLDLDEMRHVANSCVKVSTK